MKMKSSLIKSAFVLSAVAAGGVRTTLAADTTWISTDPAGSAFTTGTNWDTGLVPGPVDDAIIDNGGKAIIGTNDSVEITNLRVNNGIVEQTGGSVLAIGTGGGPTAFFIGGVSGMTGTYNVSGDSTLQGGQVRIGNGGGTGIMSLSGNASYTGDVGRVTRVADGAGSTGTLSIADDVDWVTNDWAIIGSGGTGTLNLSGNTATMTVNGNTYVGDLGGNGTLNASGSATLNSGNFQVGTGGSTGTATIQDSAKVNIGGEFFVGNAVNSNGSVVIKGNAEMTNSSWVVIGRTGGTGALTLEGSAKYTKTGGGQFSVGNGFQAASNGTMTIKDSATLDVLSGELWVGAEGDFNTVGVMNVEGGTVNTYNWVSVGRNHANGTLNISGGEFNVFATGSFDSPNTPNFVTEGSATAPAVINQTGGVYNNAASDTVIGQTTNSVAIWNASGGESNHNVLRIGGESGSLGTVNISDDAVVNTSKIYVSSQGGSIGELNLNGGTLGANFVEKGAGSGVVTFNGGVLKAAPTAQAEFIRDFAAGDLRIAAGGLKIHSNGQNLTIRNSFTGEAGDGGFTKLGLGTVTLANGVNNEPVIHDYQGATNVQQGTLIVSAMLANTPWVGVANGASLQVNTTISLNETVILSLDGGSSINLNFDGASTIGSLVLDGNIMEIGTYDLAELQALGTTYNVTFSGFDGNTSLVVTTAVPEPSTVALAILGLGGLLFLRRRSARQMVS